jgi:deazaflavin-dependent oxidoreductase (nitroreductase family)
MQNRIANLIATVAERTSALLGPRVMRFIARFNKWVTNPVQRRWAARLPNMAIVEHHGRKSGRIYRTPVMAFIESGEIFVVLNYGRESDWVRNVQAAAAAGVLYRGKRYRLIGPRVIPIDSPDVPEPLRAIRAPNRSVLCGALAPP